MFARNDEVVAIESKLLETLAESKAAEYPPSYGAAVASLDIDPSWDRSTGAGTSTSVTSAWGSSCDTILV